MANTEMKIKVLPNNEAPVTLAEAVYLGDGTSKTLKSKLEEMSNINVLTDDKVVVEAKNLNLIDTSSYTLDNRGWATFEQVEVKEGKQYSYYFLANWSYFLDSKGKTVSVKVTDCTTSSPEGILTIPYNHDIKFLVPKVGEQNVEAVYLSEFAIVHSNAHSKIHNSYLASITNDNFREQLKKDILYGHLYGKNLYCIGDSITQGSYNYHSIIADRLYMKNISKGVGSSRYCLPGYTEASNIIYNNIEEDRLLKADVITIMAGTNDISNSSPIGNFTDRDCNTFYGALHLTFQKILQARPDARIGIISPPQRGSIISDETRKKCIEYANCIEEVCNYYNIPYLNGMANSYAVDIGLNGDNFMYNGMLYDGIHTSEIGRKLMADKMFDFVAGLRVWDPYTIPAKNITSNTDTITFTDANVQTLSINIDPVNSTDRVLFTIDNNSIATIKPKDAKTVEITPVINGECNITAKCRKSQLTIRVVVNM